MKKRLLTAAALAASLTFGLSACSDSDVIPETLEKSALSLEDAIDRLQEDPGSDPLAQTLAAIVLTRDMPAHKDERRANLSREALSQHRYDAACTTALTMNDTDQREITIAETVQHTSTHLRNLPCAGFAVVQLAKEDMAEGLRREVVRRWQDCEKQ